MPQDRKEYTLKVIERIGKPYSPEGKDWVKTVFVFLDPSSKKTAKFATFDKKMEVGDTVTGTIEPPDPKYPDSLPVFRTKSSGRSGWRGRGLSPEAEERIKRQTAIKDAVEMVGHVMRHAVSEPKKGFTLAGLKYDPELDLDHYFKKFMGWLEVAKKEKQEPEDVSQEKTSTDVGGIVTKHTEDMVKDMFGGEEVSTEDPF